MHDERTDSNSLVRHSESKDQARNKVIFKPTATTDGAGTPGDVKTIQKQEEVGYHGILEVEMAAPKDRLYSPLPEDAEKLPAVCTFTKRRIGYIQSRLTRRDATCSDGRSKSPTDSVKYPQQLDVTLLRVRDVAFTLRLCPDVLLSHVVCLKVQHFPPTPFISSVYDQIYDPVIRDDCSLASLMNYACSGIMYDHMIHLEDYMRVILPVSLEIRQEFKTFLFSCETVVFNLGRDPRGQR